MHACFSDDQNGTDNNIVFRLAHDFTVLKLLLCYYCLFILLSIVLVQKMACDRFFILSRFDVNTSNIMIAACKLHGFRDAFETYNLTMMKNRQRHPKILLKEDTVSYRNEPKHPSLISKYNIFNCSARKRLRNLLQCRHQ